ncbi:MAG: N-acetylmuramoyl-L-alanine amidase, partial [Chitinophagaceae bacterium]
KGGIEMYVSRKDSVQSAKSRLFGSILQQSLGKLYPTHSQLLTRQQGIWVLDQGICPTVLVELGYITNERDRRFFTDAANQDLVAKEILNSISRYRLRGGEQAATPASFKGTVKVSGAVALEGEFPLIAVNGVLYRSKQQLRSDLVRRFPEVRPTGNLELALEATTLKGSEAVARYGPEAAGGVVEIVMTEAQLKKLLAQLLRNEAQTTAARAAKPDPVRPVAARTETAPVDAAAVVFADTTPGKKRIVVKSGQTFTVEELQGIPLRVLINPEGHDHIENYKISVEQEGGIIVAIRGIGSGEQNKIREALAKAKPGTMIAIDQRQGGKSGETSQLYSLVYYVK